MCKGNKTTSGDKPRAGIITVQSSGETIGYDNADVFVKAINDYVSDCPDDVKWHVNLKEPAILMEAMESDMSARGYETPFGLDDIGDAKPGVKGIITYLKAGETETFWDSDKYVEAVRNASQHSLHDFSFETCTDNNAVWAKLDRIVDGIFGRYDPDLLEHTMARPTLSGALTFKEYVEKRMPVDSEKVFTGSRNGYLICTGHKTLYGERKVLNKPVTQKTRIGDCNFSKQSVLARLAEKQQIVRDRESAKKRGEVFLQNIPSEEPLPFPITNEQGKHSIKTR